MPWRMPREETYNALLTRLNQHVRPAPPAPEAVSGAAERLDRMLAAAVDAFEALDRKAVLVPVAVAAIATFMADRVVASGGASFWFGLGAGVAGTLASLLAIWAFSASRFRSGPDPIALAIKTHRHPTARVLADQGVVNSLAVAVQYCHELQDVKATRLNASLLSGVIGVILLLGFVSTGGVQVTEMEPNEDTTPPASADVTGGTQDPWAVASVVELTGLQTDEGFVADAMGTAWSRESQGWTSEDMGSTSSAKAGLDWTELRESSSREE